MELKRPKTEDLPPGWLDEEEAELLWRYAEKTKGDILEVGSYRGRSSVLLANLRRKLHCVDPFSDFDSSDISGDDAHKVFKDKTKEFDNIKLHRVKIEDWEETPVGFAYLDGDHTFEGTLAQIKKALKCFPLFIAGHDVNSTGGGLMVKKAFDEYFGVDHWIERKGNLAVYLNPRVASKML